MAGYSKRRYYLYNLKGETLRIFNMRQWCKANNVPRRPMRDLVDGRLKSYRGWFAHTKVSKEYFKKLSAPRPTLVVLRTGETLEIDTGVMKWAEARKMTPCSISHLLTNKLIIYRGLVTPQTYNLLRGQNNPEQYSILKELDKHKSCATVLHDQENNINDRPGSKHSSGSSGGQDEIGSEERATNIIRLGREESSEISESSGGDEVRDRFIHRYESEECFDSSIGVHEANA